MAASIRHIIDSGGITDTILHAVAEPFTNLGAFRAALAYIFGDGFSNLAYPTNPVLLICLGLTVVSYPKWIRWTAKLWLWVILATVAFLGIAVAINFGPF